jgi:hypothetical protein
LNGEIVIRRKTPAGVLLVDFSFDSPTSPEANNLAYRQALYAAEDLSETIANLTFGTDSDLIPAPTETDRVLVSRINGMGFQWQSVPLAEILPLIGDIPGPTAGFKLLGTDSTTSTYRLYNNAELSGLLTAATGVPAPSGDSRILMTNTAGDIYVLASLGQLYSQLGLGTAARLNGGTQVGNVVVIESGDGGVPSMPAIDVGAMTGVGREIDYAKFARTLSANITLTNGTNLFAGGTVTQGPNDGAWISNSGFPTTGVTLQPGRYWVHVEWASRPSNSNHTGGLTVNMSGVGPNPSSVRGFTITENRHGHVMFYLTLTNPSSLTSSWRQSAGYVMDSQDGNEALRMHIWKLA